VDLGRMTSNQEFGPVVLLHKCIFYFHFWKWIKPQCLWCAKFGSLRRKLILRCIWKNERCMILWSFAVKLTCFILCNVQECLIKREFQVVVFSYSPTPRNSATTIEINHLRMALQSTFKTLFVWKKKWAVSSVVSSGLVNCHNRLANLAVYC